MKTKTATILVWLSMFLSVITVNAQYYADELVNSGPCDPVTILCSGVENPANAADNIGSTYATMQTIIGVTNLSYLRVGFSHPIPAAHTVGVFIGAGSIIFNADVLETLELRVYDTNGNLVGKKTKYKNADLKLLAGTEDIHHIGVTTDPGSYTIGEVKITLNGLASVLNNVRIYGVAAVPDCPSYEATSVFAEGPCDPIIPILCPGGVLNAGNAVSADNDDYALLTIPLGIGGTAYLDLAFEPDGQDGDRISFLIGQNNTLLDADLLGNLSLAVYDQNGNLVKQKSSFSLANLETSILDPSKSSIGVTTKNGNYSINHARLTLTSLVSVLSDLRVYRATTKEDIVFGLKVTPNGPLTFCQGDNVKFTPSGTNENTFQWYKNNEVIPGATNKKYTANSSGGYHVHRIGPQGCGSVSFIMDVNVNCKGGAFTIDQPEIYPNPFSDHFQVTLSEPKSQNAEIRILDISGRVLATFPWSNEGNIELGSDLQHGIYMVQLFDGMNSVFSKVIKVD